MEGMMLLEEHNPMGTATLGNTLLAGTMAVVVFMVMAVVMAVTGIWMAPVTLVGPIVGINGYKIQRGQELSELQATVPVAVCFVEELAYVVIDGHVRLQQGKREKESA